MKNLLFALACILFQQVLIAQNEVYQTFKDRWVINSQSVETLPKRKLDVRISHRFGDLAGESGGWPTFYGLENAADVAIGAEYGITNHLTVGIARSKGSGQLRQLVNGSLKYRFLTQEKNGRPFSMAVVGMTSVSTSRKSDDPSSFNYFEVFPHRMVHHVALIASRKFSSRFSFQLSAGNTHRNVKPVGESEVNGIYHLGAALRIQVSKPLALIGDFTLPLNGVQNPFNSDGSIDYYAPIGIGFEFDTGGHVFQLNITNATGIMPTDYIPYTRTNWLDGEYRIGFTISRLFNL